MHLNIMDSITHRCIAALIHADMFYVSFVDGVGNFSIPVQKGSSVQARTRAGKGINFMDIFRE